jgi:hypothetical protein
MNGELSENSGQVGPKNGENIPQQPEERGAATGRTVYAKEQKHYAALYQQSERTIKRWVKAGRDGLDLPPLDDPLKMIEWWPRHYKHKVPDAILSAARSAPSSADRVAAPVATPVVRSEPATMAGEVGTGFHEMLQRVRVSEAAAYRAYNDALAAGDEAKLPAARKTWAELSKQLRELERDAGDILAKSGALIEKAAVEKLIAEIHGPIVNGLRSMWRKIRVRMLSAPDGQQDKVWQEECDRLLGRLNESGFLAHE